jgi:hypothetical protein
MIQPIKEQLIQNVKNEVVKHNMKDASEKERYRNMQNEIENKGTIIDELA